MQGLHLDLNVSDSVQERKRRESNLTHSLSQVRENSLDTGEKLNSLEL